MTKRGALLFLTIALVFGSLLNIDVTAGKDCPYHETHDELCGYVEGDEESCTHRCSICDSSIIKEGSFEIEDGDTQTVLHIKSQLQGSKGEDSVYYYVKMNKDLLAFLQADVDDEKQAYVLAYDDGSELILKPVFLEDDDKNVYLKYEPEFNSDKIFDLVFQTDNQPIENEEIQLSYASSFDEKKMEEITNITLEHVVIGEVSNAVQSTGISLYAENGVADEVNFGKFIVDASVQKIAGTEWIDSQGTVTDGDSIKVRIDYDIDAAILSSDKKVITYTVPEQVKPTKVLTGDVYSSTTGLKNGKYTIDTDGKITITFDNDVVSTGNQVAGYIEYQAIASIKDDKTKKEEITIGTDKITINPTSQNEKSDITVTKIAELDKANNKINYTVTANSVNGTKSDLSDGLVKLKDTITGNGVSLNKNDFKLYKVDKNGNKTQVDLTGYASTEQQNTPYFTMGGEANSKNFAIGNLPALAAGESYELNYNATYTDKTDSPSDPFDGKQDVSNTVEAYGGNKYDTDTKVTPISSQRLNKTGKLNEDTNTIEWTIEVYNAKAGSQVTEQLPSGLFWDGKATLTPMNGGQSTNISFTNMGYTFPAGTAEGNYQIKFTTKVESIPDAFVETVFENKVKFKDDKEYSDKANVTYPKIDPIVKKFTSETEKEDGTGATYNWTTNLNLPTTYFDYYEYTDILSGDALGSGDTIHYIENKDSLKLKITTNKGNTLAQGTDYTLHYIGEDRKEYLTTFPTDTKVIGFRVVFAPVSKIRDYSSLTLNYNTYADYSMNANETYIYKNKGTININHTPYESNDEHSKKKIKDFEKYGGTWDGTSTWPIDVYEEDGSSYKAYAAEYSNGTILVNYEEAEGRLYYMLTLRNLQGGSGDIVITDELPEGLKLITSGQFKPFLAYNRIENNNGLLDEAYYPPGWAGRYCVLNNSNVLKVDAPEGTNVVTFTIDDWIYDFTAIKDKNYSLAICYAVEAEKKSESGGITTQYVNKATYKGVTDKNIQRVTEEEKPIEKKSLIDGNNVNYSIVVNPTAKDLDPETDEITLTDTMTSDQPTTTDIKFVHGSMKVYKYDSTASDGKGVELAQELWRYTYNSQTKHIELILPDGMACVVEYAYYVKSSSTLDVNIVNNATLEGVKNGEINNETMLKKQESSGGADRVGIEFYKIDSENYAVKLDGGTYAYSECPNGQEKEFQTENGVKLFSIGEQSSTDKDFKMNTLYKIVEKKAPEGYIKSETPVYFVIVENKDENAVNTLLNGFNLSQYGITKEDVRIFGKSGGAIYFQNQYSWLKVKKAWVNSDGTTTDPGQDSIQLQLWRRKGEYVQTYKHAVKVDFVVTGTNGYSETFTKYLAVGKPLYVKGIPCANATFIYKGENIYILNGYYIPEPIMISASIEEDVTININCNAEYSSPWNRPNFDSFNFEWTEAKPVDVVQFIEGTEELVEENISLSASNDWTKIWTNLDRYDVDKNRYFYYIKEVDVPKGWTASYNNSNITYGSINVVNTKVESMVLPEVGGTGVTHYLLRVSKITWG